MGPLPAAAGCDCQICRPEPSYDVMDRGSIDRVLEHGWEVKLVSDDVECSHPDHQHDDHEHPEPGPAFAYTVGLGHRADHPELLMSGLDGRLMHRALNDVAQRVMAGHRFQPGDVLEGVLSGVPVVLEEIAEDALRETITWSGWFHRRKPSGLVIVWPSTSGLFAWQPGAPQVLDAQQPREWRIQMGHAGGVAPVPAWVFPVPPEEMALSCSHVVEAGQNVRWVARETDETRGEDWTILCGDEEHGADDLRITHFSHLVRSAPSLMALGDLALNWAASRADVDSQWQTQQLD